MTASPYGVDPSYEPQHGTGPRVARWLMVVAGLLVAMNVAAALLSQWLDPQTDGPFGSSYVTTDQGVGAWRDVLIELERPVERLRVRFAEANIAGEGTVIVVDPDVDTMDRAYAQALLGHVDRGGRVILIGVRNMARLFDLDVELIDAAGAEVTVVGTHPLTSDVASVSTADGPRFVVDATHQLIGDSAGTVVGIWERGSGEIIAVADPRLFINERIGMSDNAVLAVRLAGGGPVAFDEFVHGFGVDQGVVGIGAVLRRVGIVGLFATLLAMWAVGKRIGPVEQTERSLPPPRAAYLDAMAITVAKARDTSGYDRLRVRAERTLDRIGGRYVGLGRSEQRRNAASHFDLSSDEIEILAGGTAHDVRELAAVAAKIERMTERTNRWTS